MRNYIQMKFSFSSQIQLGYIDFLDSRLTYESFEGPKLPQTIFLVGEGSYHNPYQLDYDHDPIIKSIGLKLQNQKLWKKFARNLNSKLWSLQINSFNRDFRKKLFDILNFIDLINKRIFIANEFCISLWIVEVSIEHQNNHIDWRHGSDMSDFIQKTDINESQYKLDLKYLQKKPVYFSNFLNYWKKMTTFNKKEKEFKLALIFQKIHNEDNGDLKINSRLSKSPPEIDCEYSTFIAQNEDGGEFAAINQSQLYLANDSDADFADRSYDVHYSSPQKQESSSEFGGGHEVSRSMFEDSQTRSYRQAEVEIQWLNSAIREPHLNLEWLKQFKRIDCAQGFMEKLVEYYQAFVMLFVASI